MTDKEREALEFVRGMVKAIRFEDYRPKTAEWMYAGGLAYKMDGPEGISDSSGPEWELDETKLPALMEAAEHDRYARDAVEELALMHLRDESRCRSNW